ncbi:MAG: LEA type 2 family protein [Methanoregula sp.]|nr:LEA type 2 family protein [Methanoregula sp.]
MVLFSFASGALPAAAILFISWGTFFKPPSADLKNAAVRSISISSLTLDVTVSVDNKNAAGIRIRTIDLDVFFRNGEDWIFLSHGKQQNFRIPAGRTDLTIPLVVRNAELLTAILRMVATGEITLRITGTVSPDLLIFAPKIPFSDTTTIPLKLPLS